VSWGRKWWWVLLSLILLVAGGAVVLWASLAASPITEAPQALESDGRVAVQVEPRLAFFEPGELVELGWGAGTYSGPGVKHTTFHSAMGLEFEVVFVVGATGGLCTH
jgi:superfamily I DNA/RNA helicase